MSQHGIKAKVLNWPLEKEGLNVLEFLIKGNNDLVINIPKNFQEEELSDDYSIRRKAVDQAIPLNTEFQLAQQFVASISVKKLDNCELRVGMNMINL